MTDPRPLDLDQLLARAADGPEPWATDVRDLVALVRQLSGDLVAAEDERDRLLARPLDEVVEELRGRLGGHDKGDAP